MKTYEEYLKSLKKRRALQQKISDDYLNNGTRSRLQAEKAIKAIDVDIKIATLNIQLKEKTEYTIAHWPHSITEYVLLVKSGDTHKTLSSFQESEHLITRAYEILAASGVK